jgi:hypothetical protein
MTRLSRIPPRSERPPLPDFAPVPRRYRHDGWTPERQKAFIEALADTGCVDRAAAMVNMAQANCYALRRAPGAEEFRRAWDAALDFGLKRLKDVAFQRAIEGQLVPVFVAGKLIGFRRVYNDKLLIFCLRHYGQDSSGKRTTINYFSTRATSTSSGQASAGVLRDASSTSSAAPQDERSGAEASATTVRTVISGPGGESDGAARDDAAAAVLNGFEGVALDAEAQAAIAAALEACAARARAASQAYDRGGPAAADAAEDDPSAPFFRSDDPYRGTLVPPVSLEEFVPFSPGEPHWTQAGAEVPAELLRLEAEQAGKPGKGADDGSERGQDPACAGGEDQPGRRSLPPP